MAHRGGRQQAQQEEDDHDMDHDDMDMGGDDMDDIDDMELPNLHWTMTIKPDGDNDIEPPEVPGWLIRITNACFGVNVKSGSRTVLLSQQDSDEENKQDALCVLLEGKTENVHLDLLISEPLKFILKGKNPSPITLSGYLQPPPDLGPEGAPSMMGDDEEDAHMMGVGEDDDDQANEDLRNLVRKRKLQQAIREDDNEAPELMDEKKESQEPPNKKAKTNNNTAVNKGQQQQKNQNQQQANSTSGAATATTTTTSTTPANNQQQSQDESKKSKQQKKKEKQAQKKAAKAAAAANTSTEPSAQEPTTNTSSGNKDDSKEESKEETKEEVTNNDNNNNDNHDNNNNNTTKSNEQQSKKEAGMQSMKNGIQYKDIKTGTGQAIKKGQKLKVYYVGQLDDKTIFDKNITGDGFEFKWGNNEVIKGWDFGLQGMKVGGKRRLVIPSNMAYGDKGTENIPPKATLTFTIEVKSAQ